MMEPWDLVVIGAGAAGLLAASRAAELGRRVLLLEKNRKPGVKILMSGGSRCNLTHATDAAGIVAAFGKPGRFLHSALAALGPDDLVRLFAEEGVPTKREATGKIFPVSDRALDVQLALLRRLERTGTRLAVGEPLLDWELTATGWSLRTNQRLLLAQEVLLTTGGQSYPGCGTTGDGYRLLVKLGHRLVPPRPALVPLTLQDAWAKQLSGVTLPDVELRLLDGKERLDQRRGSFLFTHFGCSGPVVLDLSGTWTAHPTPGRLSLRANWLPEAKPEELLSSIAAAPSLAAGGWLAEWLPRRLAEQLLVLAGIAPTARWSTVRKDLRRRLVSLLTDTPLTVTGTLGFAKAEVTAGGLALEEVDSKTLRSKRLPSLLVAGEVLDLDGPIGGFNFQAAFSTGWLAAAGKGNG